jgi:TM2 domain-containing membrane protein YozV
VAFLLSLLIPGLGQLYTGRLPAGIIWFIVVAIGYAAFIVPGIVLHVLSALFAGLSNPYN